MKPQSMEEKISYRLFFMGFVGLVCTAVLCLFVFHKAFRSQLAGNRRGLHWSIRLIWFPPDTSSFPLRISSPCSSTETCALL